MSVPTQLINPKFSFVPFKPIANPFTVSACCEDYKFCLPFVKEDDFTFQFKIVVGSPELACAIIDNPDPSQLVLVRGASNSPATVAANVLKNFTLDDGLEFEKMITAPGEVTFLWRHPLPGVLDLIACDECFQLGFIFREQDDGDDNTDVDYISYCFKRKCSECFSAVLAYNCNEDSYDFCYCKFDPAPVNRVRVPMYTLTPQTATNRNVYVRSNGSWKITKSSTTKEYDLLVDFIPENIHDRISIALEHDFVQITQPDEEYSGDIRNNSGYVIDWGNADPKEKPCVAQANFKANASPFNARNNNCEECDPPDPNVCSDVSACNADVENVEYTLVWFDGFDPINGHPRLVITWTNPAAAYPAGGYLVSRGHIIGGITVWEAPIVVSDPDLTATFIHNIGDDGDYFIKIVAVCNNTTTHETIVPYNLSNPCACDDDLDITTEIIVNDDTSTTVKLSWPFPDCGMPIGAYTIAGALAPGGVPGTWSAEGPVSSYVTSAGQCQYIITSSAGAHGTFARRITNYCGQGVTHQTIIIYTF